MPAFPPARLHTLEDVRAMPDDGNRYEIVGGELFVTPAPGLRHQTIQMRLALLLGSYIETHRLGQLFAAPTDVVLGPTTLVEPDLVFVRRHRFETTLTGRDVQGAPDLVVEILSPTSGRTDRGRKRALYQGHGVAEYWIIDPELSQAEVWRPIAMAAAVERDRLTWRPDPAVPALAIDLPELFRPL
jgi:Uma2 family endonuclease